MIKLLVSIVTIIILMTTITFAGDCEWTTVKKVDGGYLYSIDCHLEVGKLVKNEEDRIKQVEYLEKSIEYKDLVIDKYEDRLNLWIDTSEKLEKKINTIDKWKTANQYLYFGLGVIVTSLSVYLAGQVYR